MRTRRAILKYVPDPFSVTDSVTVDLPRPAEEVWEFMWSPASSVALFDDTEVGMTLPGTPAREVGEIQVFLGSLDGTRTGSLHEVVELEPGHRAVTRSLDPSFPAYGELTVEPLTTQSCRVTQGFRAELPAGSMLTQVEAVRAAHRERLGALARRRS